MIEYLGNGNVLDADGNVAHQDDLDPNERFNEDAFKLQSVLEERDRQHLDLGQEEDPFWNDEASDALQEVLEKRDEEYIVHRQDTQRRNGHSVLRLVYCETSVPITETEEHSRVPTVSYADRIREMYGSLPQDNFPENGVKRESDLRELRNPDR